MTYSPILPYVICYTMRQKYAKYHDMDATDLRSYTNYKPNHEARISLIRDILRIADPDFAMILYNATGRTPKDWKSHSTLGPRNQVIAITGKDYCWACRLAHGHPAKPNKGIPKDVSRTIHTFASQVADKFEAAIKEHETGGIKN